MKKIYFKNLLLGGLLMLFTFSVYSKADKTIICVGAKPFAEILEADTLLLDSISQWINTKYMSAGNFNDGKADTLYAGVDGVIFFESIGSNGVGNFGSRDNFPVPSITMEAGVFKNDADGADPKLYWNLFNPESSAGAGDGGGIWGFTAGTDPKIEAVDLQWKITNETHYITKDHFKVNDVVTWSEYATPEDYGIPYIHGLSIEPVIIATAARAVGPVGYMQSQALAVAEIVGKKIIFMNAARDFCTAPSEDFWGILKRAVEYRFDAIPVGVQDNVVDFNFELTAFPNPASSNITINYKALNSTNASISILDMTGKEIINLSKNTVQGNNFLFQDVSNFASGMYIVKLQIEDQVQYTKFIVK